MATDQQIAANRRNAQRSTGPRTPEGKARSSQNAFKTGLYATGIIIGHESAVALEDLERQFTAEHHPVTPTERSLVDSLIHLEWMLRRYRWLETEVWKSTQDLLTRDQLESGWTGHAFISQPAIARIHRLRTTTQRVFHETLAELQAAQNKPPDPEIGFVPPEQEPLPPDAPKPPALTDPEFPTTPADQPDACQPVPRNPGPLLPTTPALQPQASQPVPHNLGLGSQARAPLLPTTPADQPQVRRPAPHSPGPKHLLTAGRPGSLTCRRDGADRRSDRRQSAIWRFRRLPGACGAPQPGSVPIGFSYDWK